jgi:hypothetical protein
VRLLAVYADSPRRLATGETDDNQATSSDVGPATGGANAG